MSRFCLTGHKHDEKLPFIAKIMFKIDWYTARYFILDVYVSHTFGRMVLAEFDHFDSLLICSCIVLN